MGKIHIYFAVNSQTASGVFNLMTNIAANKQK